MPPNATPPGKSGLIRGLRRENGENDGLGLTLQVTSLKLTARSPHENKPFPRTNSGKSLTPTIDFEGLCWFQGGYILGFPGFFQAKKTQTNPVKTTLQVFTLREERVPSEG